MRRTPVWAVAVFAAFALAAAGAVAGGAGEQFLPAAPPSSAPLVAEKTDPAIAKLIQDLGDEDYKVREKAGRDLLTLGEKALPAMRVALREAENPELQLRLAVMVRK